MLEQDENAITICLESALNIADAAEFKEKLQAAFESDLELRIDLSKATGLDVCMLQLLFCAEREWRHANRCLVLIGPLMDEVSSAVASAGLEALPIVSGPAVLHEV